MSISWRCRIKARLYTHSHIDSHAGGNSSWLSALIDPVALNVNCLLLELGRQQLVRKPVQPTGCNAMKVIKWRDVKDFCFTIHEDDTCVNGAPWISEVNDRHVKLLT